MPYCLPSRHRFAHDYALFLHDHIVHLLKSAREAGVFSVKFELRPGEVEVFQSLDGERLYEWIEINKGRGATAEMDFKEVFPALATDLCHFALEGIRTAAKGKLTVAHALFRKPFKDNLFLLEWMLADRTDFLSRFEHGSPDSLDAGKLTLEERTAIVTQAVAKADAPGVTPEKVFDIRFDRKAVGFASSGDRAIHLLTTWKHNRTQARNLNFIFSGPGEWETQWASIYWGVPYLLYYTTFVVDALFSSIAVLDERETTVAWLRRAIGYELWAEYTRGYSRNASLHPSLESLLSTLKFVCCSCSQSLRSNRRNLREMVIRGSIRCHRCAAVVDLEDMLAP